METRIFNHDEMIIFSCKRHDVCDKNDAIGCESWQMKPMTAEISKSEAPMRKGWKFFSLGLILVIRCPTIDQSQHLIIEMVLVATLAKPVGLMYF